MELKFEKGRKKMNYYIADLHIGHKNILRLSNRPFKTMDQMIEKIIENWNKTVKAEDDVYILGDVFYRYDGNLKELLQKLNGHKHLIIGNHEKQLLKNKQALYMFDSVDSYKEITDTLNGKTVQIIMCHYPLAEWNGYFRNSIHLFGHIHNNTTNDTYKLMKKIKNAYNVGADILNFTPQTLKNVIELNNKFWKEH